MLPPRSTANLSDSLSVQLIISGVLILRIPAFPADDHSIVTASLLEVAVIFYLVDLHSSGYVLPLGPAHTISLPPSLRGEAKFESVSVKIRTFFHASLQNVMNVRLYATVSHAAHDVFELFLSPIIPSVQVSSEA